MNRGVITISESGTVSMPTDTVWMTMQEIADMYNVFGCYVRKAVKAVFKDGILKEQGVRRHVRKNDRISYDVYSLELVIAVAFRIDSIESRAFREFIMQSVIGKQTSRTKLVCIFTENTLWFSSGSRKWVWNMMKGGRHNATFLGGFAPPATWANHRSVF